MVLEAMVGQDLGQRVRNIMYLKKVLLRLQEAAVLS
jgi:hypothetical protein